MSDITRASIDEGAKQRGLAVHASVTDERLSRVTWTMQSRPDRLTQAASRYLDADATDIADWMKQSPMRSGNHWQPAEIARLAAGREPGIVWRGTEPTRRKRWQLIA